MSKKPKFELKSLNRATVEVKLSLAPGESQWILLSSDRHWDNPKSDRKMQKKHLEEAKSRGAGVVDLGDLFCAMQGKYDPRSSKKDVLPEHNTNDYIDAIVSGASEFLSPYAEHIISIGQGNHETSILNRLETDLTTRLVKDLNTSNGTTIHRGGYSGWVFFRIKTHGKEIITKKLHYFHGSGGDSPSTKGAGLATKMAVYLPDADIVATGHSHNEWQLPLARARVTNHGRVYHDEQYHIKVPSYKEEYRDGYSGWAVERGSNPKPVGAIWLRFYRNGDTIETEVTRAK